MTGQVYFSETDEGGRYIFIPMGTSRVDGPFEFLMDYIRISVPGGGSIPITDSLWRGMALKSSNSPYSVSPIVIRISLNMYLTLLLVVISAASIVTRMSRQIHMAMRMISRQVSVSAKAVITFILESRMVRYPTAADR
jgi:hypothetical protein